MTKGRSGPPEMKTGPRPPANFRAGDWPRLVENPGFQVPKQNTFTFSDFNVSIKIG